MGWESSDVFKFDLGPLLQGQLHCETYRKIMGWKSSDMARFYLGPLLEGQTKIAKVKSP